MDRRFFYRLGASQLERTICSDAGEVGLQSVIGIKMGTEPEQFAHSRYIIAWGSNIHGNNVHLWPFIEEARRKGAKLVVIDPYRTRTAKLADWYLPINPGTDAALALGMMHVIIGENLFDGDYVSRYTVGFEELKARAEQYPPERVAQWTGISAEDIRKLAREYATVRPSVIRVNYGIQRSDGGGMAMRAVTMLPCLIGSWKEVGGGLQLSTSGAFGFNTDALRMPELMNKALGRPARMVNMVQLGTALNTMTRPPIKALFVYNSNPAAVCPNHNEVVRGLMRDDLFTVVHEQFFTDTTDYADIVLPATTFFEHKDLVGAYGHYFLQVSEQAIEPLGECRSNVEVFRGLAERMGFEEECFRESVDGMIEEALDSGNPRLEGITRERLEREHWVRLELGGSAAKAAGESGAEIAALTRCAVQKQSAGPISELGQGSVSSGEMVGAGRGPSTSQNDPLRESLCFAQDDNSEILSAYGAAKAAGGGVSDIAALKRRATQKQSAGPVGELGHGSVSGGEMVGAGRGPSTSQNDPLRESLCFAQDDNLEIVAAAQDDNLEVVGGAGGKCEVAAFLPFAEGNFSTASGKAEFYSEGLKALGLDPVVAFTPPGESRNGAGSKSGFPLELLARKPDNHLNSSFANVPSVRAMEPGMGELEMHPRDAEARGVRNGDQVRAFNSRGEIVLRARVNGSVAPGVVAARLDWARFGPGGRNINVLTSEKLTDMGNAATFYSVCVEVEPFRA
jgi:anaerobic selenocysteine-containing dehydrogenase